MDIERLDALSPFLLAVETALGRDCFYVAPARLSQKSAPGNNVDVTFSTSGQGPFSSTQSL
jgi:hypothetical protein